MTHRVRPATPADGAAIEALLARSYPTLLAPDYDPEILAAALPAIIRAKPDLLASGTYFVATLGDTIHAAGGWTETDPATRTASPAEGHIRHVVCDPDVTRQGLATAILAATIAQARGRGIARLHCLSTLTAQPFYAACGFAAQGPVSVLIGGTAPFPAIAMVRDL